LIAFVRAATFSQCILGMDDMRDAHLRDVDLNLLRTIQPLLEERHISRAAQRAFLSQPAMSRALNRLRETFGDLFWYVLTVFTNAHREVNASCEKSKRSCAVLRRSCTISNFRLSKVASAFA